MHALGWRTAHASSIDEKGLIYIFKATSAPPRAGTTGKIGLKTYFQTNPVVPFGSWVESKEHGQTFWDGKQLLYARKNRGIHSLYNTESRFAWLCLMFHHDFKLPMCAGCTAVSHFAKKARAGHYFDDESRFQRVIFQNTHCSLADLIPNGGGLMAFNGGLMGFLMVV